MLIGVEVVTAAEVLWISIFRSLSPLSPTTFISCLFCLLPSFPLHFHSQSGYDCVSLLLFFTCAESDGTLAGWQLTASSAPCSPLDLLPLDGSFLLSALVVVLRSTEFVWHTRNVTPYWCRKSNWTAPADVIATVNTRDCCWWWPPKWPFLSVFLVACHRLNWSRMNVGED